MARLKPNQFILDGHTFTELPLLFQTLMVQAVLEDRKSQTRRTRGLSLNVDGVPKKDWEYTRCFLGTDPKDNLVWMASAEHTPTKGGYGDICPYGKPGDLLWVRETFIPPFGYGTNEDYMFKTDWDLPKTNSRHDAQWKPSIHMPKAACRIWLMVEEIRVERLQDISEEDAVAEGCSLYGPFGEYRGSVHPNGGTMRFRAYSKASRAFQCIWEEINGEKSWKANPWVWVVKFRTLSKTGRPSDELIMKNWKEVSHV